MSHSGLEWRRKLAGAHDLQSVVGTMKAVAASGVGQYERAVESLSAYSQTVEMGLGVCLRSFGPPSPGGRPGTPGPTGVVILGSDQGLVGRFNETVALAAGRFLAQGNLLPRIWTVGDRVRACLADAGYPSLRCYPVPASVHAITTLVGDLLVETQEAPGGAPPGRLIVFSNRPTLRGGYEPVRLVLYPWEDTYYRALADRPWPAVPLPEVLGSGPETFRCLVREALFIGLFRACAGSLASENTARLAAMQRAEKNLDDLIANLTVKVQKLRQTSIDEELFDLIAGAP